MIVLSKLMKMNCKIKLSRLERACIRFSSKSRCRAFLIVMIAGIIPISLGGLVYSTQAATQKKILVVVSIAPQKYFVQKIAGNRVNTIVMVKAGANPATYEPKPKQLAGVTRSEIYFAIGVPFEAVWLKRMAAVNPKLVVVQSDAGIEKKAMEKYSHSREAMDPHVWLAPIHVKKLSENMLNAFIRLDPASGAWYRANYNRFLLEIDALDAELKEMLSIKKNRKTFMVFHPSWGYFAESYGLKQVPVEIEGKTPKAKELNRLIRYAREKKIESIFVQPQFSKRGAKIIADAIGGRVLIADPLAEQWADNLRRVAQQLKTALR